MAETRANEDFINAFAAEVRRVSTSLITNAQESEAVINLALYEAKRDAGYSAKGLARHKASLAAAPDAALTVAAKAMWNASAAIRAEFRAGERSFEAYVRHRLAGRKLRLR